MQNWVFQINQTCQKKVIKLVKNENAIVPTEKPMKQQGRKFSNAVQ
jgi:hypothetical protein